jgi:hypothetical protein
VSLKSLITGKPVRYSHSSHEKFDGCQRSWAFYKIAGLRDESGQAAKEGGYIHEVLEMYLGGDDPEEHEGYARWWPAIEAILPHLPEPGTVDVEHEVILKDIDGTGMDMVGYLDWYTAGRVSDLKTKSNLDYALTPKQLAEFNQPNVYAYALAQRGDAPKTWTFEHVYTLRNPLSYDTKGEEFLIEGFPTVVERDHTDVVEHWETNVLPVVHKMADIARTTATVEDINRLPYNTRYCKKYGRLCPAAKAELCTAYANKNAPLYNEYEDHDTITAEPVPAKETPMNRDLKSILGKYNKNRSAAPAPAKPAPKPPSNNEDRAAVLRKSIDPLIQATGSIPMVTLNALLSAHNGITPEDLGLALDGDTYYPAEAVEAAEPEPTPDDPRDVEEAANASRNLYLGLDFLELREVFPNGVPDGFYAEHNLGRAYGLVVDIAHKSMSPAQLYEAYDREDTWADVLARLEAAQAAEAPAPQTKEQTPEEAVLAAAARYLEEQGYVTEEQLKDAWRDTGLKRVRSTRIGDIQRQLMDMGCVMHDSRVWTADALEAELAESVEASGEGEASTNETETQSVGGEADAPTEEVSSFTPSSVYYMTAEDAYHRGLKDGANSPGAYERGFDDGVATEREEGGTPGRFICIGCDMVGMATTPFATFIAPFTERACHEYGVEHYKLIEFGKGPGAVAAVLRATIRAGEVELPAVIAEPSRSHPLIDVIRDVLVTEASYVVVI